MKIENIHEMYDQHTLLIMKMVLTEGSSCIDVGAHVGEILREMISIAPHGRHYAFEPIPSLYEGLRANQDFKNVQIRDLALSDEAGDATFFWVKNDPAYSGLKERRYDRPDPEIVEIKVRKARLDDVIERDVPIDLIKIDVEGGELPVLRGAKRIITERKPFIVFESGKGASDRYGTNGGSLFDYLVGECGLEINTLDGFLTGQPVLGRDSLERVFDKTERYYFIAHRPLSEAERMQFFRMYTLDLDSRFFSVKNLKQRVDQLEGALLQLQRLLPDVEIQEWGPKETRAGLAVNRQPDGTSAIWIHARNVSKLGDVYLQFGRYRARGRATVVDDLVTSEIPEAVIQTPGDYIVEIFESSGRRSYVGTFIVKPFGSTLMDKRLQPPLLNPVFMEDGTGLPSPQIHNQRSHAESEAAGDLVTSRNTHVVGTLSAFCYLCGPAELSFSTQHGWQDTSTGQYVINWREHLICPRCGLNNRMRATVHFLDTYCSIAKEARVYITEQNTRLFRVLQSSFYPNIVGSEFLGNACPLGKTHNGMRNEDMTRLTFADNTLAGVFSFDVLEHIPDYRKALAEVYRCLAPGGEFVFSAPFDRGSKNTLVRAEVTADGSIRHLLPPEYYGDPVNPNEGILCFQHFGWDLLSVLRETGFEDVKAVDYWSRDYGYFGNCLLFTARKSGGLH